MDFIIDAAATGATIATFQGQAVLGFAGRTGAIECFGECPGHLHHRLEGVAGKQISMRQPSAPETALQQLGDVLLLKEVGEHWSDYLRRAGICQKKIDGAAYLAGGEAEQGQKKRRVINPPLHKKTNDYLFLPTDEKAKRARTQTKKREG